MAMWACAPVSRLGAQRGAESLQRFELGGVNMLLDDGSGNGDGNRVPEPGTLVQALTLLGALLLMRRRRA